MIDTTSQKWPVVFLYQLLVRCMRKTYTVTKDADMLAPSWLAARMNYTTVKILYRNIDGHAEVKGVRVGNEVAEIGDVVSYDGKRLSVEKWDWA